MKKSILSLIIIVVASFVSWGSLPVVVSIVPEQTFVKAIGGDEVSVDVMVSPGSSPHTYEPKPSQMREIASAKLYLSIGVEFEQVWLPKFRDLNPHLHIIDVSHGIKRRAMVEKHTAHTKALDPHVWTTPANVAIIARNILDALVAADPSHANIYHQRYNQLLKSIKLTDHQIHEIIDPLKGSVFMVFHPSWGYFADSYGLSQIPVQIAGKNPKPRDLIALIQTARSKHVRAIFTQPETPDTMAGVLARELHIPVIKISPMSPDWSGNLLKLAKAIAHQ